MCLLCRPRGEVRNDRSLLVVLSRKLILSIRLYFMEDMRLAGAEIIDMCTDDESGSERFPS